MAMIECLYLGHVVGRGQVRRDNAKVTAIQNFLRSKKKKDVRSFIGLAGYYRRFVPNYSAIATPLTDLTKKDCPDRVVLTEQHQTSFDALKKALSSDPVLQGPDYTTEFVLHSDASDVRRNRDRPEPDRQEGRRPSRGLLLQEAEGPGEELRGSRERMSGNCGQDQALPSLPDGHPLPGGH